MIVVPCAIFSCNTELLVFISFHPENYDCIVGRFRYRAVDRYFEQLVDFLKCQQFKHARRRRLLPVSERSHTKQVAFALRVCLKVEFAIEL